MKKILSYIIILALSFVATITYAAIDGKYKNNLLNVELNQTPDNRVSVLLVFEQPYSEPVKVVYKSENEYNILLPETFHSITSINTGNTLNVLNASAKLVPYFDQENANGYTKIVLKTSRPVIFNAHASYVTTKIAESNLLDDLEKDPPKVIKPTTVQQKETPKPVAKAKPTTAKKPVTTTKTATKPVAKKPVQQVKKAYKPVAKTATRPAPKPVSKPTPKPAPKPVVSNKVTTVQTQTQTQKGTTTQQPISNKPEPIMIPMSKKPVEKVVETIPEPPRQLTREEQIIQKFNDISKDENTLIKILIGALALLILMLLKVSKEEKTEKTKQPLIKRRYTEGYTPNTATVIPNEIKNMTWQEKFRYMKRREKGISTETEQTNTSEINTPLEQIDDFEGYERPQRVLESENHQTQAMTNPFMQQNLDEITENISIEEPIKLSESTLEELSDISDIEPVVDKIYQKAPDKEALHIEVDINEDYEKPYVAPTLINQAKISKTKGFYLIRYENEVALVGYIKDKIFLINSFNDKSQSFVQTRLTEKKRGADIYMVRSDNYKALVEVSKDEMKPLITL